VEDAIRQASGATARPAGDEPLVVGRIDHCSTVARTPRAGSALPRASTRNAPADSSPRRALAHSADLGASPDHLVVAGESAGGNGASVEEVPGADQPHGFLNFGFPAAG
jgi:hypothetical protein